jgi:predicted ATPase
MAKLEGFRIRNFRSLKDISMGSLWTDWNKPQKPKPLTPMTAVIGKNGAGKSTLFDAFGLLADCLKVGVEEACDSPGRGGFSRIRSQGQSGPIEFEIYYKEDRNARPITYELAIDIDRVGRPYVLRERLRQRGKGQKHGRPFSFLIIEDGRGVVWKGESKGQDHDAELDGFSVHTLLTKIQEGKDEDQEEIRETEIVELEDKRKLGIATLGSLKQHPRISAFGKFVEGWYLSYFSPDAARGLPYAGPQRHLNSYGDNLSNVVQYMERDQTKRFQVILDRIAKKIPGIQKIDTLRTDDQRLLLRFNEKGFVDPFYAQQMSDGTMKVFAYLLLLEDPDPPPFLCIEEPENGLYHKLLEPLAKEFRALTENKNSSQVFITTHQPYLVDALEPNEVWVLEKGKDGFSKIRRASDDPIVNNMVEEGLPLGGLWFSDYLEEK